MNSSFVGGLRLHFRVSRPHASTPTASSSPLSVTLSPQCGLETLKCNLSPPTKILFTEWICLLKLKKNSCAVKKQLSDLSNKIDHTLQPVLKSRKIREDLKMREPKPSIINQRCVVYNYKYDLCDAEYVGYTSRRLHQRLDEHRY